VTQSVIGSNKGKNASVGMS